MRRYNIKQWKIDLRPWLYFLQPFYIPQIMAGFYIRFRTGFNVVESPTFSCGYGLRMRTRGEWEWVPSLRSLPLPYQHFHFHFNSQVSSHAISIFIGISTVNFHSLPVPVPETYRVQSVQTTQCQQVGIHKVKYAQYTCKNVHLDERVVLIKSALLFKKLTFYFTHSRRRDFHFFHLFLFSSI